MANPIGVGIRITIVQRLARQIVFLAGLAAVSFAEQDLPVVRTTVVVTASPIEPDIDRRNSEAFTRTLFSRDDQVFHLLDAGINAGQHEGGGKSVEIRRFGFNLDHGGVNGGLKILVDDVQQNQTTQAHGQGYLGSLKTLMPELIQEINIVNGPFSAEYGDFSGLGVVHIKLRESMPDVLTTRFQAGSFGTRRAFIALSPTLANGEALIAYEGSRTDGPFLNALRYSRHNLTTNYTRRLDERQSVSLKFNGGLSGYHSSGQLPVGYDPFGYIDPTDGGNVRSGTSAIYYRRELDAGQVIKADAFVGRSLFDLYSNFTFFLNDPVNGDAIQQHDSRLQQGANVQYQRPGYRGRSLHTAGANFHDNQINVGSYPRVGRTPVGVSSLAHVRVANGAGYVQEGLSLFDGKLQLGAGLRFDAFRFDVTDAVAPVNSGVKPDAIWQPKASVAYTPSHRLPVTFHANYGRGISTSDARAVVQYSAGRRVATTDFYQVGTSHNLGRVSLATDLFLIDRSNEKVYIPDDGTFEFKGPSRAYGFESRVSIAITRKVSLNGGITKVANAFYRGTGPRLYVDSAPHFVANGGLTIAAWKGWSGSIRLRAINHYRLDGEDPSIVASGHTVVDIGLARRIRRGVELNLSIDNATDRFYYETQNYFESRLPGEPARYRIHGTPGYPVTVMAGFTFRLGGK
jgi:TonB dependent receptor/TonB-dependent Receptor Plug Domain